MTLPMLPPAETVMPLIDHQGGTMSWVGSIDQGVSPAGQAGLPAVASLIPA